MSPGGNHGSPAWTLPVVDNIKASAHAATGFIAA
jgi:hypothetical protein